MAIARQALQLKMTPVAIGISGASGSGKTTLAVQLARRIGGFHFPLDNYYRDLSHLPFAQRVLQNFDDPALIESPLLAKHVAALARGMQIERPIYDFATHTRVADRTETVTPGPFLLVEGLFALYYPELQPLYHLRVYVEAPDEVCFERRLRRDMVERGRTAESVKLQYDETVRPAFAVYIQPAAENADLVVDGTADLEAMVQRVMAMMHERGLLRVLPQKTDGAR